MMHMRFYMALILAKMCAWVLRKAGRRASQHPGWIALGICPRFLELAPKAALSVCVTGTNGKTTVSNLLTDALILSGKKVVSNRAGANVDCGCATNVVDSLTWWGKCRVDATVFEVDERFSRCIIPYLKPDYLAVTNLFRDSLKRNAHPEYIFDILNTYCPKETKLILNADDLCSSALKPENGRIFYGVGKQPEDAHAYQSLVMDHSLCPRCGAKLHYRFRHYHHIGQADCPSCEFHSPKPDYLAQKIDKEKKQLTVISNGETEIYPLMSDVIFNVYNQMTVLTVLKAIGLNTQQIQNIFSKIQVPDSRLNETVVHGVSVIQAMSKGQSCISSSRTFDLVASQPGRKVVVLALDDAYDRKKSIEYSGWIYDVDAELLCQDDVIQIAAFGPRCLDHQVRLLMAGIPQEKIFIDSDEMAGIERVQIENVDRIYILYDTSTYLLSCEMRKKLLRRLEEKR